MLNLVDLEKANRIWPLFRLAFRPLFLAGAVFSLLAIGLWIAFWLGKASWNPYGGWLWWHAHEMIFGFVAAIVVGFLLTAVQNWTGIPGLSGWPLALLVLVWLVARALILFPVEAINQFVPWVDVSFLLGAAAVMAVTVYRVKQWRNFMFAPILLLLAFTNAQMHWAMAHGDGVLAKEASQSALYLVVFIMVVMGGRVIPFFTANATQTQKPANINWLEKLVVISMAAIVLLQLFSLLKQLPPLLAGSLFLVAAIASAIRFSRWQFWLTAKISLLWSLHLSYVFIVVGLLLVSVHFYALHWTRAWSYHYVDILHTFTVGGMGLMILSMISRVSLGHTGRPIIPSGWMSVAFLSLALALLCRVVLPLWPVYINHTWSYTLSMVLWLFGYSLFVLLYFKILVTPRADGRPG